MMLYLVRHGIAEAVSPDGDDASRHLTPRGRVRMQRAAAGLRRLGVRPAVVLTSPLPRAAESAAILVSVLAGRAFPAREVAALAPETPPLDTLRALRLFARHHEVMAVGHQPNLGRLLALLLTGSPEGVVVELKKGACAALELPSFVPGGGVVLRWLAPPRVLRRLA